MIPSSLQQKCNQVGYVVQRLLSSFKAEDVFSRVRILWGYPGTSRVCLKSIRVHTRVSLLVTG